MEEKTKAKVAKSKDNKTEAVKCNSKEFIEKGKKNGSLTYKEIMEELDQIDLSPEQIEKIYEVLESMEILMLLEIYEV